MQDIATVVTNIKTNLRDLRMQGIALFINDLIARSSPEVGVPRYRITSKSTGAVIESFDQFIDAVTPTNARQSYPYTGERLSSDRVVGYYVLLRDLEVRFNSVSGDDIELGRVSNLRFENNVYYPAFYMAYLNDADPDLPVKITSVRLLQANL